MLLVKIQRNPAQQTPKDQQEDFWPPNLTAETSIDEAKRASG